MRFLKNSFVLSEFFIWQNIWSSKRQSHCVPEHKLLFGSWFVAVEFVHQPNKIRWTFFMVMRSFFSNDTVRRIFKFSCIFRKKRTPNTHLTRINDGKTPKQAELRQWKNRNNPTRWWKCTKQTQRVRDFSLLWFSCK